MKTLRAFSFAVCLFAVAAANCQSVSLRSGETFDNVRFALLQQRSIQFEKKDDGTFGLTALADGLKGFAGITIDPKKAKGKLSLNGLLVTDVTGSKVYAGALGLYEIYRNPNLVVKAGLGAKGFDLASGFDFEKKYPLVFGFTVGGKF